MKSQWSSAHLLIHPCLYAILAYFEINTFSQSFIFFVSCYRGHINSFKLWRGGHVLNNSNSFQPHNFKHFHIITSLLSAAAAFQVSVVAKKTGFYRPMKVRMCRMSEPIHNQEHENSSKHRQQGSLSFRGVSHSPDANYTTSFSQYCSRTTAVRTYKKRSHSICPYLLYIQDTATVSSQSRSSVFSERPRCLENSCLPVDRRDRSRWCAPLLHCIFSPLRVTLKSHRAETLTMLMPAALVVVWMLGDAEWLKGGLLCTGPWRLFPSGLRSGGAGRLMIAVVIRPPLQLILLLLSSFRFRLERPDRLKYRGREEKAAREMYLSKYNLPLKAVGKCWMC